MSHATDTAATLRQILMSYRATSASADAKQERTALQDAISVLEAETNARPQQTLSSSRVVSIANTLLEEFLILKHGKTARWQTIADVIRREIARYNGQPDPQPTPEAPKWTPSDTHSECDNCARVWPNDKLSSIEKASERIAPGEEMPSGQCPECGCLCHPLESSIDSKPATDEGR